MVSQNKKISQASFEPQIGLVLATLNAMPHLRNTFEALNNTGYKKLKIFVQDGVSDDGTLEYLESQKKNYAVDIVSAPDTGVGQAYSRGLKRLNDCDFAVIISADETLKPHFFEKHLEYFSLYPDVLAIYGSSLLVNPENHTQQIFHPGSFTLNNIVTCETVPPISTCMFNVKALGEDFYYDHNLITCMDYEFWVRLALKYSEDKFLRIPDVLSTARMDGVSMSFNSSSYLSFARDKVTGLKSNLKNFNHSHRLSEDEISEAFASIYCWAAEMVHSLEGANQDFVSIVSEAMSLWGSLSRLDVLVDKSDDLKIWVENGSRGKVIVNEETFMDMADTTSIAVALEVGEICVHNGANQKFTSSNRLVIEGGNEAWGYAWTLDLEDSFGFDQLLVSVSCFFNVNQGQMSVCTLSNNNIEKEVMLSEQNGKQRVSLKVRKSTQDIVLCIRNAGLEYGICELENLVIHTIARNDH